MDYDLMWRQGPGRPSMEELFRAAIDRQMHGLAADLPNRQRVHDPPVLRRDIELMDFKSENFFFSRVCDFDDNDELND